eukprot:658645-Prorocentrum_minimum.AAC.1
MSGFCRTHLRGPYPPRSRARYQLPGGSGPAPPKPPNRLPGKSGPPPSRPISVSWGVWTPPTADQV